MRQKWLDFALGTVIGMLGAAASILSARFF